jgi:hypothetical protein
LVGSAGDVKLIVGYDQGVMSGIITYAIRLRELILGESISKITLISHLELR